MHMSKLALLSFQPRTNMGQWPRRTDQEQNGQNDWKKRAPRWLLGLVVVVLAALVGAQYTKLDNSQDREARRIEAALLDAPTKYQARLSERVAVNEEQMRAVVKAVDNLSSKVEQLTAAILDLRKERK
jgi:hypothetical protein